MSSSMIAIVGPTGSGKTTAMEFLDQEKTLYINLEKKDLPFNHNKLIELKRYFKLNYPDPANESNVNFYEKELERLKNFMALVWTEAFKKSGVTTIVVDSMAEYGEYIDKYCELKYTGYDIWANYSSLNLLFLNRCKGMSEFAYVIVLGHQEYIKIAGENTKQKVFKTNGKKLEGNVEAKFTHVLFTDKVEKDDGTGDVDFVLKVKPNFIDTTKVPRGLFPQDVRTIPNDITVYLKALETFHRS